MVARLVLNTLYNTKRFPGSRKDPGRTWWSDPQPAASWPEDPLKAIRKPPDRSNASEGEYSLTDCVVM